MATHRFTLAQKFRTNGAIDVKYVHFMTKHGPQHFIIVANANGNANKNNTHESNAIVYRYTDGSFMAYQEIKFENTIKQFLPVLVSISFGTDKISSGKCTYSSKTVALACQGGFE